MSSFSNTMLNPYPRPNPYPRTSLKVNEIAMHMVILILCIVGFCLSTARLRLLYYGQSRPIPHWRVVMVTVLFITAVLQIVPYLVSAIMYASGHHSRLGKEVIADNLTRLLWLITKNNQDKQLSRGHILTIWWLSNFLICSTLCATCSWPLRLRLLYYRAHDTRRGIEECLTVLLVWNIHPSAS